MKTKTHTSNSARALKLNRILVPTDFSRNAAQALRYAVPLARQVGGQIVLLHVVEWPVVPSELGVIASNETKVVEAAKPTLDLLARRQVPEELLERTVVRIGRAPQEISRAAQGLKIDMIVVSTKGRTGLRRALLGSTAERIVRHAPCPVLTVRRVAETKKPGLRAAGLESNINRILVPVDFSMCSKPAVRYAADLACLMGARLALVHVVPPLPVGIFSRFPDELARGSAETKRQARQKLDALAMTLPKSLKAEVLLRQDTPHQGILEAAREWRSDLIVLPTRGLTGVKYIVLGSTAEAVVRYAHCPVLTLGRAFLRNDIASTAPRP